MKVTRYISVVVMFVMLACSEPIKVEPYTYPEIFTGETKRAWSIRSVQFLEDGKGTQTFNLGDCVYDDLYIFYNNVERAMQITEGATKCSEEDPSTIAENNWSFVNATATLMMVMPLLDTQPYTPLPFILKEIDDTKMVLDIYLQDRKAAYRFNFKIASVE